MPLSEKIVRVWPLTVTVPAGTPINAPITVPWFTEDAVLQEIEILIPPGPNGTTGIRVMKGDVQLLPWGANSWIVANDYNRTFPIGGYLPTADIKIQAYNVGANVHSFYLRMSVVSPDTATQALLPSTTNVVDLGTTTTPSDPLSPDAILGTGTTAALADGTLTAADVTPLQLDLTSPSVTDSTIPAPTL